MRRLLCILAGLLSLITVSAHAEDAAPAKPALAITSTAFLDGGIIPVLYTCDGKDIPPQIDWTDAPATAQTFALLLTDSGAPDGTFYHWVLYNIPKKVASIPEGQTKAPAGASLGKNGFKKEQYSGPCPPKGSSHTYVFNLYALDAKLDVPAGAEGKTVEAAMKNHIVSEIKLSGVYSRWLT